MELFSFHPTKQTFPCWNLCLLPVIPLLCTSGRTHLCCSPPKALLGCCEVHCEATSLPSSVLTASFSWQGLQPTHLCSPSLLEDVKLDTMASLAPQRKAVAFHFWLYWFDLCVYWGFTPSLCPGGWGRSLTVPALALSFSAAANCTDCYVVFWTQWSSFSSI